MKFIDLFAGIGGIRSCLEKNGHECVAFCEIDKFARQSYKALYDTKGEKEFHDIKEVTDEDWREFRGEVDILCGGFPCQSFSHAGDRKGFDDIRGTLFFEIVRAAEQIIKRYIFFEYVNDHLLHEKWNYKYTDHSTL